MASQVEERTGETRAQGAAGQKRVRTISPAASDVAILEDQAELGRLQALVLQQAAEKGVSLQQLQEAAVQEARTADNGDEVKWTSQMVVLTRVLELLLHNQRLKSLDAPNPTTSQMAPTPMQSPATGSLQGSFRGSRGPARLPFQFPAPAPTEEAAPAANSGNGRYAGSQLAVNADVEHTMKAAPDAFSSASNNGSVATTSAVVASAGEAVPSPVTGSEVPQHMSGTQTPLYAAVDNGNAQGPSPASVGSSASAPSLASVPLSSTQPSPAPKANGYAITIRNAGGFTTYLHGPKVGHSLTEVVDVLKAQSGSQPSDGKEVLDMVLTSLGDTMSNETRTRLEQLLLDPSGRKDRRTDDRSTAVPSRQKSEVAAVGNAVVQDVGNTGSSQQPVRVVQSTNGLFARSTSDATSDDLRGRGYSVAVEVGSTPGALSPAKGPSEGPSAPQSPRQARGLEPEASSVSTRSARASEGQQGSLQPGVIAAAALGLPLRAMTSSAQDGASTLDSARSDAAARGTPVPSASPLPTPAGLPSARTLARTFDEVAQESGGQQVTTVASVVSMQELSIDSGWQDTESFAQCIRAAARTVPQPVPAWQHKSLKLLVAGGPGLGKTTLINNLLASYLEDHPSAPAHAAAQAVTSPSPSGPARLGSSPHQDPSARPVQGSAGPLAVSRGTGALATYVKPHQFLSVASELSSRVDVTDEQERIVYHYTLQEGLPVVDEAGIRVLEQYIQQQQDAYLVDAEKVEQEPVDCRVDAVLYLLPPHKLGQHDLHALRSLSRLVPLIPLLAKCDTMTPSELNVYRDAIMRAVREQERKSKRTIVHRFHQDVLEEAGFRFGGPPFLVMCSESYDPSLGRFAPIREYQWGVVEALRHSDLAAVKRLVFEVAYANLRAATEKRFRHHRADKKSRGRLLGACAAAAVGLLFFGLMPSSSSEPLQHRPRRLKGSRWAARAVTDEDYNNGSEASSAALYDEEWQPQDAQASDLYDPLPSQEALSDRQTAMAAEDRGIRRKWQSKWKHHEAAQQTAFQEPDVVKEAAERRERVAASLREYHEARQAAGRAARR